jgi:phosphohistidine swiveling domain-containing protein
MPPNRFFISLRDHKIPPSVGNKAINLRRLMDKGLRVPVTYVCDWSAYHLYLENDANLISTLQEELRRIIDPDKTYAVRSSANIEDSLERSFAGQFKSVLNVRSVDQIVQAMWSIWATATSPAVQAYLERHGIPTQQLSMAVIVQEMVPSVAAGVALSRNPVTSADEVIVEAVCGTGDALVQSGVSPSRWANKWGNWLTKPEGDAIPLTLAEEIVDQTHKIARVLKSHVDLEWAWDGKTVYWLQVREITTLHQRNVYSNYMSKEMLPGMIKPLIWSVNIPMKSVVFVKFMNELLGETGIKPEELIKSFYYRVYFNMGVIGQAFKILGLPDDSLEMMMGLAPMGSKMVKPTPQMLIRLPRMVVFAHKQWTFHSRTQKTLPDLEGRIKSIRWQDAGRLDEQELLMATEQLYQLVQEVTYYNILCPILAVMHTRMFSRELKRLGVDLSQFDVTEGLPEAVEYDPATHLHRLHAAFEKLDPEAQQKIHEGMYAGLMHMDGVQEFQKDVTAFIERFGYLSDNGNDFSCTPWREKPDLVLDLILNFKSGPDEKSAKVRYADLKVNFLRRGMVKLFFERVRTYRLLREQLSAYYTYTYGLFRYYYLVMGEYLVKRNIIDTPADVFYLADTDVRQMLAGQSAAKDCRAEVAKHKVDMERFQDIVLPSVIYGDEEPPVAERNSERLIGLATSLGHYTGPVKVVLGIKDFAKVLQGDVLVIPYSDVGWTPLFARAGAVVAESGGLLSHSSIIAREYGIPAVVSVNGAMNLCDDMRVTVDGHKGEIIIHPVPQVS